MKKVSNLLWGLAFIIVGVIFGSNALGFTNIDVFFSGWWTLFIIVPCFIGIFSGNDVTGDLIGLLIGVALLLACNGVINFALLGKLILPAILIIIGLSFIFRDTIKSNINKEIKNISSKRAIDKEYCSTFGGQTVSFDNEEFTGAELTAVFGGIKCDLTNAKIKEDVVINATSIFGGIDIKVPENVQVKTKTTPVFGGTSNKVVNKKDSKEKTIYVNSTCVFGGVDIK